MTQAERPALGAVPGSQGMQSNSSLVPKLGLWVPGGQPRHVGDSGVDQVPGMQSAHAAEPVGAKDPPGHTEHVDSDTAPRAEEARPPLHWVQEPAPAEDQVPLPQVAHVLELVATGLAEAVPAGHSVQDAEPLADHLPGPHATQCNAFDAPEFGLK